jgi:hypothetical protein
MAEPLFIKALQDKRAEIHSRIIAHRYRQPSSSSAFLFFSNSNLYGARMLNIGCGFNRPACFYLLFGGVAHTLNLKLK